VSPFEQFDDADIRALVDEFPLAWVCGDGPEGLEASLLPLIGRYDESGRLVELIGHLMRSNPLHGALAKQPRATILFKGPDAYVSPEHAGLRDWGPTWNFAQLRIAAEVSFDEAFTETALEVLIAAMEAGRSAPWQIGELGSRYQAMLGHIIGFRARVIGVSGRFKLGQDEKPGTLRTILDNLPDAQTVAWMRRLNRARL
jgi:transcriptional regulator